MRREAKVEAVSDTGGAAIPEGNWEFGEVDITSIPAAFSVPSGAASDTSGSSVSSAAWEHAITWLALVFKIINWVTGNQQLYLPWKNVPGKEP